MVVPLVVLAVAAEVVHTTVPEVVKVAAAVHALTAVKTLAKEAVWVVAHIVVEVLIVIDNGYY